MMGGAGSTPWCPPFTRQAPPDRLSPRRGRPVLAPATILRPMAKVCHSCGKGPAFGNNRSHSLVATRRRFNPNLQKVRVDVGGGSKRVYVCTRCLKANKVTKAV